MIIIVRMMIVYPLGYMEEGSSEDKVSAILVRFPQRALLKIDNNLHLNTEDRKDQSEAILRMT